MTPVSKIESCIGEIRQWMRDNMLALNDDETEVVCFSSKFVLLPPVIYRLVVSASLPPLLYVTWVLHSMMLPLCRLALQTFVGLQHLQFGKSAKFVTSLTKIQRKS